MAVDAGRCGLRRFIVAVESIRSRTVCMQQHRTGILWAGVAQDVDLDLRRFSADADVSFDVGGGAEYDVEVLKLA